MAQAKKLAALVALSIAFGAQPATPKVLHEDRIKDILASDDRRAVSLEALKARDKSILVQLGEALSQRYSMLLEGGEMLFTRLVENGSVVYRMDFVNLANADRARAFCEILELDECVVLADGGRMRILNAAADAGVSITATHEAADEFVFLSDDPTPGPNPMAASIEGIANGLLEPVPVTPRARPSNLPGLQIALAMPAEPVVGPDQDAGASVSVVEYYDGGGEEPESESPDADVVMDDDEALEDVAEPIVAEDGPIATPDEDGPAEEGPSQDEFFDEASDPIEGSVAPEPDVDGAPSIDLEALRAFVGEPEVPVGDDEEATTPEVPAPMPSVGQPAEDRAVTTSPEAATDKGEKPAVGLPLSPGAPDQGTPEPVLQPDEAGDEAILRKGRKDGVFDIALVQGQGLFATAAPKVIEQINSRNIVPGASSKPKVRIPGLGDIDLAAVKMTAPAIAGSRVASIDAGGMTPAVRTPGLVVDGPEETVVASKEPMRPVEGMKPDQDSPSAEQAPSAPSPADRGEAFETAGLSPEGDVLSDVAPMARAPLFARIAAEEAEAQRLAEAEARRVAEAEAEARRIAEAEAAAEAQRIAEAEAAAEARRVARAKAEARRVAEAEAEARRVAEAKAEAQAAEAARIALKEAAEEQERIARIEAERLAAEVSGATQAAHAQPDRGPSMVVALGASAAPRVEGLRLDGAPEPDPIILQRPTPAEPTMEPDELASRLAGAGADLIKIHSSADAEASMLGVVHFDDRYARPVDIDFGSGREADTLQKMPQARPDLTAMNQGRSLFERAEVSPEVARVAIDAVGGHGRTMDLAQIPTRGAFSDGLSPASSEDPWGESGEDSSRAADDLDRLLSQTPTRRTTQDAPLPVSDVAPGEAPASGNIFGEAGEPMPQAEPQPKENLFRDIFDGPDADAAKSAGADSSAAEASTAEGQASQPQPSSDDALRSGMSDEDREAAVAILLDRLDEATSELRDARQALADAPQSSSSGAGPVEEGVVVAAVRQIMKEEAAARSAQQRVRPAEPAPERAVTQPRASQAQSQTRSSQVRTTMRVGHGEAEAEATKAGDRRAPEVRESRPSPKPSASSSEQPTTRDLRIELSYVGSRDDVRTRVAELKRFFPGVMLAKGRFFGASVPGAQDRYIVGIEASDLSSRDDLVWYMEQMGMPYAFRG